jgi:hypothetical protein
MSGDGTGSLIWRWNEAHGEHCCSPNASLADLHHASWTGYWLLRWRDITGPAGEPVPPMLRRYAELLLRSQRADGMWPAYIDPATGSVAAPLSEFNGESGTSALFLLQLHSAVGGSNSSYLDASLAALRFTTAEVFASRRWWDFETFWSCSPKPEGWRDEFTGASPEPNHAPCRITAWCCVALAASSM